MKANRAPWGHLYRMVQNRARLSPVAEEPGLELLAVSAPRPSCAREFSGNFFVDVRGYHVGDGIGDRVVRFKDTVWVSQGGRFVHGWVLGLKDVQHRTARLGAQASGDQDTTAARLVRFWQAERIRPESRRVLKARKDCSSVWGPEVRPAQRRALASRSSRRAL